MEEINLDLDSNVTSIDLPISSSSESKNNSINIVKNDNVKTFGVKPINNKSSSSIETSRESNIGLELLMNKKKTGSVSDSNQFKPETKNNLESDIKIDNLDIDTSPSSNITVNKKDDFDLDNLLSDKDNDVLNLNSNNSNSNDNKSDGGLNLDDLNFSLDDLENGDTTNNVTSNVSDANNNNFNNNNNNNFNNFEPQKSYEDIQKEKFELLCNLERLEDKGIRLEKKYTMESDFKEMKMEYDRVVKRRETDASVKFQRKMLVAFVTAVEFLNGRFDPLDIKLNGWSESVHENIGDYDDVFEELHEKYKEKSKMAPELKLMLMLGGSAFMFHLTNTMFKSSLPGMGDIMKQNPDLMRQFASATANSMAQSEPGFGGLMGEMFGGGSGNQQPAPRVPEPPRNMQRQQMPNRQPPRGTERKEMKPPPDLDSILNDLSSGGNRNSNKRNVDITSDFSESDVDNIRNIKVNKNGKQEITLDF